MLYLFIVDVILKQVLKCIMYKLPFEHLWVKYEIYDT